MSKPKAAKEDPELKRMQKEAKAKAEADIAAQKAMERAEEAARMRGLRGFRALQGSGSSMGFLGASTSGPSLLA